MSKDSLRESGSVCGDFWGECTQNALQQNEGTYGPFALPAVSGGG